MQGFNRSLAVVLGVDAYRNGIPLLRTAVNDARAIAALLEQRHGYEVLLVTDAEVSLANLRALFGERLRTEVGEDGGKLLSGEGAAEKP